VSDYQARLTLEVYLDGEILLTDQSGTLFVLSADEFVERMFTQCTNADWLVKKDALSFANKIIARYNEEMKGGDDA